MNEQLSVGDSFQIKHWIRSFKFCVVLLGVVLGACIPAHAVGNDSGAQATQTSLSVTTGNTALGTKATFVAHVISLNGSGLPAGVVTFQSAAKDLGSAVVDSNGTATLKTGNLTPGSHQVVAVYRGDISHSPSLSPTAQVDSATSTIAAYTVTASPSSLDIPLGAFGSSTLTVTPVNGFNAFVTLACNGLPAGTICVFTPSYLQAVCTPGSGGAAESCPPVYSTMQIQTYEPQKSQLNHPAGPGQRLPVYAFAFPALLGLAGLGARKRRTLWNVAAALMLFAGAMSLTACNVRYDYLNHGPTPNTGTPPGVYSVTIDAASTTGSQITKPLTPVQLTVTIGSGN